MTDTTERGAKAAIKRAFHGVTNSASRHDVWAIRLVFVAGLITILHKAGVPVPAYVALFGVCLGIAALLYEMNATTFALRAFWKGRPLSALGWSFVWLVAFAYSMNQWIGAASESEGSKTNVHQTAFAASATAKDNLKKAKNELDRVEGRLAWMDTAVNGKPVRSIEAAQSDLDNAQAHKFWNLTNGCKETKGPQTREFCNNVAAWKSEKSLASERLTLQTELKTAKEEHAKAVAESKNTKTEASEARNDMLFLTKYGNMKLEDAQALNAVGSILAISIFLSVATALRELEHLRSQGPRTKWFSIRGLIARVRYYWDPQHTPAGSTTIITDRKAQEAAEIAFSKYARA